MAKKVQKWFAPETHTGWRKDMPQDKRRRLALKGHGNDKLATARGLQSLSNVTKDKETKQKAASDAQYFYRQYRKSKK